MNLLPLNDHVIVRRTEAETRRPSGIVLPDAAAERAGEGVVLAVGPGVYLENGTLIPPKLHAGERVLFSKFSGHNVKVGDDELLVLRAGEIFARFAD